MLVSVHRWSALLLCVSWSSILELDLGANEQQLPYHSGVTMLAKASSADSQPSTITSSPLHKSQPPDSSQRFP